MGQRNQEAANGTDAASHSSEEWEHDNEAGNENVNAGLQPLPVRYTPRLSLRRSCSLYRLVRSVLCVGKWQENTGRGRHE